MLHRVVAVLFLGMLASVATFVNAQEDYPTKPIRIIVPAPAGGATDTLARAMAERLATAWGVAVYVENRPGASATVGVGVAARAAPDGYTLVLACTSCLVINPVLYRDLPYDVEKDLQPVMLFASMPNVLIVNKDFAPNNLRELVALLKVNPGKFNYASAGSGNSGHITAEWFKNVAGVNVVHVPFAGETPGVTALLAGQVQMMFVVTVNAARRIKQGQVKGIAVASAERVEALADVETFAEGGLKDFDSTAWFAFYTQAGVPRHIVRKLNAEMNKIVQLPDIRARLGTFAATPGGGTVEELDAFYRSELVKWRKAIAISGAKVDN